MQQSEIKRVKPKPKAKVQRDPSMTAGARGGEEEANEPAPKNTEVPIIQRYSE